MEHGFGIDQDQLVPGEEEIVAMRVADLKDVEQGQDDPNSLEAPLAQPNRGWLGGDPFHPAIAAAVDHRRSSQAEIGLVVDGGHELGPEQLGPERAGFVAQVAARLQSDSGHGSAAPMAIAPTPLDPSNWVETGPDHRLEQAAIPPEPLDDIR